MAAGELDLETAPALADVLGDAATDTRSVVLDLQAVTYLDPSAVATVAGAVSRMRGRLSVLPPDERAGGRVLGALRPPHHPR